MAVAESAEGIPTTAVRKPRSPMGDAFRQLLKNKVAVISGIYIIILILMAIFAPLLAPSHFAEGSLIDNYAKPGTDYLFGADFMGRDILSRTIYGTRVSLLVAIVAATVSLIVGVTYGLISGFFGGRVDEIMMRIVDFLYGMPVLIFVILLQVYFKALSRQGGTGFVGYLVELNNQAGGLLFLFIAIGLLNWLMMARIARGQVLSIKQKEFIEASQAVGAGNQRIISKHLLPNILGPCIVQETLMIPGYILLEAFLSFIGLGVNAPTPSWGIMLQEGYQALRSNPHVLVPPAIALTVTMLAFNFLGDGLRDALDPRMRQ
jgi:oligopeptide transport system permease protein